MKSLVAVVLCLVAPGVARTAVAQDAPSKVEISGGWNYMAIKDNGVDNWTHYRKGWYSDVAVNLNEPWAVVGQIAGGYSTREDVDGDIDATVHPFLIGARASLRTNPELTPYAQFLLGGTNIKVSQDGGSQSTNNLTFQVGGGVNVQLSGRFGARVAADYIRIKGNDDASVATETVQGLRLAVGLVFGFGG